MRCSNFLLLLSILTSCAFLPKKEQPSKRIFASVTQKRDDCGFLIKKIVSKEKPNKGYSLSKVLTLRKELKHKYSEFIESIRDFKSASHKPIKGRAKLILNPHEGYLSKILMIKNAKSTIDISYYIFKDDDSSQALLHELRLAIKRGVKVRILLDSTGSITNAPFYHNIKSLTSLRGGFVRDELGHLIKPKRRAKAEAVIFNPVINIRSHVRNWYRRSLNLFRDKDNKLPLITHSFHRRSHDKILLVDARYKNHSMAIIGGRNIANYYYNFGKNAAYTYEDAEIMIRGLVDENTSFKNNSVLSSYYNKLYYYMANKNFKDFILWMGRGRIRSELKTMREGHRSLFDKEKAVFRKLEEMQKENYLNSGFDEGLISIVNELQNLVRKKAFLNPIGKHNRINGDSIVRALRSQMEQAKETIDIVSPYLWLSDDEMKFLKDWVSKDPNRRVRLISNSVTTTDNIPAQAMVDTILGPKLVSDIKDESISKQIQVYAYGRLDDESLGGNISYGKLHGKFSIIDGESSIVGTSNLDPRSRYLNTEVGVSFKSDSKDSRFNRDLQGYMDSLVSRSYLWGSPEWQQVREHEANRISVKLQEFAGKVIHYFNLVPLI